MQVIKRVRVTISQFSKTLDITLCLNTQCHRAPQLVLSFHDDVRLTSSRHRLSRSGHMELVQMHGQQLAGQGAPHQLPDRLPRMLRHALPGLLCVSIAVDGWIACCLPGCPWTACRAGTENRRLQGDDWSVLARKHRRLSAAATELHTRPIAALQCGRIRQAVA